MTWYDLGFYNSPPVVTYLLVFTTLAELLLRHPHGGHEYNLSTVNYHQCRIPLATALYGSLRRQYCGVQYQAIHFSKAP